MEKLKLNFLDDPSSFYQSNLIEILEGYGKNISDYAKDYFSHTVTSSTAEGTLTDFTLHIIAPEIAYAYEVVKVKIINITELNITFFTLVTKQKENYLIDISQGTAEYENRLREILSSNLFNASLKFLVDEILSRREYSNEVRDKIIIGEAKKVRLKSGEIVNAGFQRIEGNEVLYYTGKGLKDIFDPNMTPEQHEVAEQLKRLSEEELMRDNYMARAKISDFEEIF